jgi:hypothetical protein
MGRGVDRELLDTGARPSSQADADRAALLAVEREVVDAGADLEVPPA